MRPVPNLAWVVLLVSACGHSPAPRLHTLAAPNESQPSSVARVQSIVMTGCSVPESIDRPQFVVTTPDRTLHTVEHHRWDEPLKRAIPRAIAHRLRTTLPDVIVWSASTGSDPAALRLALEVARWQSVPGGHADVEILWELRRGHEVTAGIGHKRVETHGTGDPYEALTAAHRQALDAIADEIAAAAQAMLRKTQH